MRDLAYIAKIEKLESIKDKDRIELATIGGFTVIVEKGKYQENDLVIYCEYDTILPVKPEFEFLRSRCYSKLYNGFRISAMKMAGVISQGIVFSLDILPKDIKIKEGLNVADILNIQKYDPEAFRELNSIKKNNKVLKFFMKNKAFRKIWLKIHVKPKRGYPSTVKRSEETNIQKLFDEYKEKYNNTLFYLSEKVEGQSATFLIQKNKYKFLSHNVDMTKSSNSNWQKISNKYNIEKRLRDYKKKYKKEIAIQGEIAGPGIQKNIYKFKELKLFIFKITNTKTGVSFNYKELKETCDELDLAMVPILEFKTLEKFKTIEDILKYSDGKSCLNDKVLREGIVWRNLENQNIGFKAKSPEYIGWFSKNDKTE